MLAPADLEAVILGLKENRSVEDFRRNNQLLGDIGRSRCPALEALLAAVQSNTRIVKLGIYIQEGHFSNEINKQVMKNNEEAKAYNKRLAAEEADREEYWTTKTMIEVEDAAGYNPEVQPVADAERQ